VVKLLLKKGAEVNMQSGEEREAVVRLLVEKGARVNAAAGGSEAVTMILPTSPLLTVSVRPIY